MELMMIILERQSDSQTVASWPSLPSGRVQIPGTLTRIHSPTVGMVVDGYEFKEVADPPQPIVPLTESHIEGEWSRRVFGGFAFNGKQFHSHRDAIDNIAGAVSWARQAVSEGVNAGNLHWDAPDPNNPPQDKLPFAWKAMDGTFMQMDAPTVISFGIALARHKQAHFLAAQALKAMATIPDDYASDAYWPAGT